VQGPGAPRPAAVDCLAVITDRLRPLAREAWHLPERLLHPWRRRTALRCLGRMHLPHTVLFVCHGNICRSPYAAAVARRLLPATVAVESAGFVGPDRPSPPEAVAVAAERGIDLAPHRSQLLEVDHVREVDLVIVMDDKQRNRLHSARHGLRGRVVLLGDLDPEPATRRTIPDPVDQPAEVFRACYDRIDRCVGALAGSWGTARRDDTKGQSAKLE
jgi:protein-tyrosine-phosphatase